MVDSNENTDQGSSEEISNGTNKAPKTADMIAFEAIKEDLEKQGFTGKGSRFMVKGKDGGKHPPTVQSMVTALVRFGMAAGPKPEQLSGLRPSEKGRQTTATGTARKALGDKSMSTDDKVRALQAAIDALRPAPKAKAPEIVKGHGKR